MTVDEFRAFALSLPEATESSHMDHPDFRVRGKIFATLGYPDSGWAMVKLPATRQARLIADRLGAFEPAPGAWGRGGATLVKLRAAPKTVVRNALGVAWATTAPKTLARRYASTGPWG